MLATLHWLRVPERVDFKLAVQSYRVLHGMAPEYMNVLQRTADLASRRHLRSSASGRLEVPAYKLNTVGRRSFAVSSPLLWNTLPLRLRRHCLSSELGSRHSYSGSHSRMLFFDCINCFIDSVVASVIAIAKGDTLNILAYNNYTYNYCLMSGMIKN